MAVRNIRSRVSRSLPTIRYAVRAAGADATAVARERLAAVTTRAATHRFAFGLALATVLAGAVLGIQHGVAQVPRADERAASADLHDDYRLGQLDKIKLRVFEYRASRDEVYEWTAFNGEYTIGASGRLAVPLIGEVKASGLSTTDLGREIGERLKIRMGLAVRPDASVEIVQFRPFYIVGFVDKPGEYAFRPGLTVLQALSLGGGARRRSDEQGARTEREIITTRGEIDQLATEHLTLLARRARLEAEVSNRTDVAFPEGLAEFASKQVVKQVVDQERLLFLSRRQARLNQLDALAQLRDSLSQEAKSIERQIATHDKQMQLLKSELSGIMALSRKQLVTESRRLALERSIAQAEGDRLRLETALMRSRQEYSRTAINMLEIDAKFTTEVTAELQQTQLKLEQARLKVGMSGRLLRESEMRGPGSGGDGASSTRLSFRIVRRFPDRQVEVSADENTQVEPGDTIKVDVVPGDRQLDGPSNSDAEPPSRAVPLTKGTL